MPDPPTILNKIDEKFAPTSTPNTPPPPPPPLPPHTNQGWENGTCWLLRGFILDSGEGGGGWGFAVLFYSVQDCRLIGSP